MQLNTRITPKVDLLAGTITIEEFTEPPAPFGEIIARHAIHVVNTRDKAVRDALICLGWTPPRELAPTPAALDPDARLRTRAHDPGTSVAAAERAALFAGKHSERILAAMARHEVMTARTIADATGLTVVQVCRRLPELKRAGRIKAQQVQTAQGPEDLEIDGFTAWRLAGRIRTVALATGSC